jgi:hypothetical protein
MLSERESVFGEYIIDRRFKSEKGQGLLSKFVSRRGISRSKPLDRDWMVDIRREGARVAGGELNGDAQPEFLPAFTNSAI